MPRSWRCLWNISRSLLPFFENYANCSFLIKWLQPETLKNAVTLLKHERSRRVRHLPFTWENREFRLQNQMVHARSVWEASENMGCDLRRCTILLLSGCTTDLDMLYSHRVKFSSINFMHKIACITGALLAKPSERCILRETRNKCKARDEPVPPSNLPSNLPSSRASHLFRASRKMLRSPRLAHKAPVMQAMHKISTWRVLCKW